jgi:hypothetical protein
MLFVLVPLIFLSLFVILMAIDSFFFNGKYLNRSHCSREELKTALEGVLSQENKPIENWDIIPQNWINDIMNIPIKDSTIDQIRLSVVNEMGDGNSFKKLTPEIKLKIQKVIDRLK